MSETVVVSPRQEKTSGHGKRGRFRALLAKRPEIYLVPITFIIIVTAWETLVKVLDVPEFVLPGPIAISEFFFRVITSASFYGHLGVTMSEVFFGYLIGVFLATIPGALISQVRLLERSVMPYIVAFQAIPSVALAPLFVVWFGFDESSKVVMAAVLCFFPIMVNVIAGLKASDPEQLQMMRSFGANATQVFWKVKVRNSLPYVFTGLKIGILFALIGAIVGEFVGSKQGVGYLTLQYNYQFNIAGMFSVLIVLSIMGIVLHGLIGLLEKRVVFWTGEDSNAT